MLGLAGIFIALGLLIVLAYRGYSVLLLAPFAALVAVAISGDAPLLASYTQVFMQAAGDFIVQFFPVFLLGALFGKLMDDSGSARAIAEWTVGWLGAQRAILAVVLSCAVLTYGGVSLFVVAFAVFPIAQALFKRADLPKRLIPATIALGGFTFTMTALPGSPAIQNAIPMPFFGTTAFAAPGLGLITGAIMLVGGQLWLDFRSARARAAGETYAGQSEYPADNARQAGSAPGVCSKPGTDCAVENAPGIWVAALPVLLVIIFNLMFSALIVPTSTPEILADPKFGSTTLEAVRGLWAIITALTLSIIALIMLNRRRLTQLKESIDEGSRASVLPIFNTASQVGFGSVIASLSAFEVLRTGVLGLGGANPLISLAVSVSVLAGITGSASGGMSIALQTLGSEYAAMAVQGGISMDLMHRVTTVATGGLDSLPHNGAVITLLAICGLTHRQSYADIFVVAVLIPIIALVALIALGTYAGTF